MELVVISDPLMLNKEQEMLCSLFEEGLVCFHLRKPGLSMEQTEQFLLQLPQEFRDRVVLHSHYGLAGTYRLKGIHGKLPLDAPAGISISSSFHSLRECIQTGHRCDYAFLSPVFDSISKRDYKSGLDKNELTALLKNRPGGNKLIALGGIDEQTIPVALGYGFDGVAVLGALWTSPNPLEKYKRLRDVTASFHLSITHHHA